MPRGRVKHPVLELIGQVRIMNDNYAKVIRTRCAKIRTCRNYIVLAFCQRKTF